MSQNNDTNINETGNDRNEMEIPIRNLYFMLAYYFDTFSINDNPPQDLGVTKFEEGWDWIAVALDHEVNKQLKKGLMKNYIDQTDDLYKLRGKIDFPATVKNRINRKLSIVCEFSEYSSDIIFNRIIKTALGRLIRNGDLQPENIAKLKKIYFKFDGISEIASPIAWQRLVYPRNNAEYKLIIFICRLVLEELTWSDRSDEELSKLHNSSNLRNIYSYNKDDLRSTIFEGFIRNYYKKHYPELEPGEQTMQWYEAPKPEYSSTLLPNLRTDVTLVDRQNTKNPKQPVRALVIDAKYHNSHNILEYNSHSKRVYFSPQIVFQMYAYMSRTSKRERINADCVSGVVIYAKTDPKKLPDMLSPGENNCWGLVKEGNWKTLNGRQKREVYDFIDRWKTSVSYPIDDYTISFHILDLTLPFEDIKRKLEGIIKTWKLQGVELSWDF